MNCSCCPGAVQEWESFWMSVGWDRKYICFSLAHWDGTSFFLWKWDRTGEKNPLMCHPLLGGQVSLLVWCISILRSEFTVFHTCSFCLFCFSVLSFCSIFPLQIFFVCFLFYFLWLQIFPLHFVCLFWIICVSHAFAARRHLPATVLQTFNKWQGK